MQKTIQIFSRGMLFSLFIFLFVQLMGCKTGSRSLAKSESYFTKSSGARITGASSADSGESTGIDYSGEGHRRVAQSAPSGLKAGYADDNQQFNYFLRFLKQYQKRAKSYQQNISERIHLRVLDKENLPVHNAHVKIYQTGKMINQGLTFADGSYFFYPSLHQGNTFKAKIESRNEKKTITFDRQGKRHLTIKLKKSRPQQQQLPVDIVFILDTTGSMGEEIRQLKKTIELIKMNIAAIQPKPAVRFGMVLYRDRGDTYNTKVVPLTASLKKFQKELNKVQAGGGGDGPENLQAALYDTIYKIHWNRKSIRLGFVITDAEPHLDYGQRFTYLNAAAMAKKRSIKLFTIGTGGLNLSGEYVLRQIAQMTYGKYIFLTYGEQGESEGGRPGSVSHHTGAQFSTHKLESVIIRFTKEEIAFQSNHPLAATLPYFSAQPVAHERPEQTLTFLFKKTLEQLLDYSSLRLNKQSLTAVAPFTTNSRGLHNNAAYLQQRLILAARKNSSLRIIEREGLNNLLHEIELEQAGVLQAGSIRKVGSYAKAKLMILGKLFKKKNKYELYLKLVRVETAEILSVTKAEIDIRLGLKEKA